MLRAGFLRNRFAHRVVYTFFPRFPCPLPGGFRFPLLPPMADHFVCLPKQQNTADHLTKGSAHTVARYEARRFVVTHATPADVVVRVRRRVVPVCSARTGVDTIIPVPAKDHGVPVFCPLGLPFLWAIQTPNIRPTSASWMVATRCCWCVKTDLRGAVQNLNQYRRFAIPASAM